MAEADLRKKIENLMRENAKLKKNNWLSKRTDKKSYYFILIDTKYKPDSELNKTRAIELCNQWMQEFTRNVKDFFHINKPGDLWNKDYIKNVRVKYVVEVGKGILKKDGSRGKVGGTVHIHIYLMIDHKTSITIVRDKVVEFFSEEVASSLGSDKIFVGGPRLIHPNYIEEYMEKDLIQPEWQVVDL